MIEHTPECRERVLVLEQRKVPETGKTVYREKCRGCGQTEEVSEEDANTRFQQRSGYFIPTVLK